MYYLLKFILISEYLLQGEQSIALTGFTPAGLIQLRGTPENCMLRKGLRVIICPDTDEIMSGKPLMAYH